MSRRLGQLSDESLEGGGRGARKAVEEAGFDKDLKRRLEERIASAGFKSQNAAALSEAELDTSGRGAGQGTKGIAAAQPWTGSESAFDTSLRMLTDTHKPMRSAPKIPNPTGPAARLPTRVDTGRSRARGSTGARLASARDRTSIYSTINQANATMSAEEREKYRAELKARFKGVTIGAAPATLQGLASLANERIEDAIARGQFKNIPRGQKVERDQNADNPFLDTTEYFMNKMIKKQDIVPPWIEKQQELISQATKFRSRLRNDWKRHAARTIASRGGSLPSQMRSAREYALAEEIHNPVAKKKVEKLNTVDSEGHVSQITLAGELKATPHQGQEEEHITVTATPLDAANAPTSDSADTTVSLPPVAEAEITATPVSAPLSPTQDALVPASHPFRDPNWEKTELPYHTLTVKHLNTLTRSYNLQAPALAQKPYFSLARELNSCYAEVAPLVAEEIRSRALAPKPKMNYEANLSKGEKLFDRLGVNDRVRIAEDRRAKYGFREMWRDMFKNFRMSDPY